MTLTDRFEMPVRPLILPPRYSDDTRVLQIAAREQGRTVVRLGNNWQPSDDLRDADVTLYGEPMFVHYVAEQLGVTLIEPAVDWLTTLPHGYVKRQVRLTTVGAVRTIADPIFVKPPNDKFFPAWVYADGAAFAHGVTEPDSTEVLTSEPVTWLCEYRCFVLDRAVVASSLYDVAEGHAPIDGESEAAVGFCGGVINDPAMALPSTVVVDVGIIAGKGWAVIEANEVCSSGIYECDPKAVLRVLDAACLR
jgi:hypothetical protein